MITTSEEYRQATQALRQSVEAATRNLENNKMLMGDFLRYRAAKNLFFPKLAADDLTFFRQAQYNVQLSGHLERLVAGPVLLGQATAEGDLAFVQQRGQQPYIFCTFHFGSYQTIGFLLQQLGFDFAVLTLREGITSGMIHHAIEASGYSLDVLHADSPNVMLEMQHVLQRGKSVMAFIDGNADTIKEADYKSHAHVRLLEQTLLAKKGIPTLSYATGVPIVPIVSYRTESEEVRVVFGSPIWPDRSVARARYVQHALQTCYSQLEHYLRPRPEQWLYWRLIQNYLELASRPDEHPAPGSDGPTHYIFNQARYELHQTSQAGFLRNRRTQEVLAISAKLSAYLQHTTTAPTEVAVVRARLHPTLLQELLGTQVLRALYQGAPS